MTSRRVIVLLLAIVVLAGGCHQFTNPADPWSTAYMGQPVVPPGSEVVPDPLEGLPDVTGWKAYVEHQFDQWIGLPIDEAGSYVESRSNRGFGDDIMVGIVFDGALSAFPNLAELSVWAVFNGNALGTPANPPLEWDLGGPWFNNGGTEAWFWVPAPGDDGRRTRVEIRGFGQVIASCEFGWLLGDVDGNGTVEAPGPDGTMISSYVGNPVDPGDELSIRSDVNADGWIDSLDVTDVTGRDGLTIDGTVERPE